MAFAQGRQQPPVGIEDQNLVRVPVDQQYPVIRGDEDTMRVLDRRGIPGRGEFAFRGKDDDRSPGPLKDVHAPGAVNRKLADMAERHAIPAGKYRIAVCPHHDPQPLLLRYPSCHFALQDVLPVRPLSAAGIQQSRREFRHLDRLSRDQVVATSHQRRALPPTPKRNREPRQAGLPAARMTPRAGCEMR